MATLQEGQRDMRRHRLREAGFTLIELMIVIVILGLLAAIVMPRIVGETDKARYGTARAQMRVLEDALKRYKLDHGVFPTTEQGLDALVMQPSVGNVPEQWPAGGYLDKQEIPPRPLGQPLHLHSARREQPGFRSHLIGRRRPRRR